MLRLLLYCSTWLMSFTAIAQTTISFSVDQPSTPFSVDAGSDQDFNGEDQIFLGGEPTASGGFESYTYQWNNASSLDDATSANPEVIAIDEITSFFVNVTDTQGNCVKQDKVLVDYTVSTNSFNKTQLKAFPNPFDDKLSITASEEIAMIRIFDITGRIVSELSPNRKEIIQVNTTLYGSGIYLVQIEFSNGLTQNLKLCKRD